MLLKKDLSKAYWNLEKYNFQIKQQMMFLALAKSCLACMDSSYGEGRGYTFI